MASVTPLNTEQRMALLAAHPDWQLNDGGTAIRRTFRFADFSQAFAFMTRVAMLAEQQDHHPEWFNVYNRVEIMLTTHDAGENGGALSARDARMAAAIDALGANQAEIRGGGLTVAPDSA